MDVRCERCRAEYVIADEEVGEGGLAVRCAGCGHVFRVTRKAFVVTMPLKPEELRGAAPVSTAELERRRREAAAVHGAPAGEGPVVVGQPAPWAEDRWEGPGRNGSAGDEPAWAGQPSAPEPAAAPRAEPPRRATRRSVWPKLLAAAVLLAAGAAVVLLRPDWIGLGPVTLPQRLAAPAPARPADVPSTAAPRQERSAPAPSPAPLPNPLPAARGEGAGTPGPAVPAPAPAPAVQAAPAPAPVAPAVPQAPVRESSSPPAGERAGRGGSEPAPPKAVPEAPAAPKAATPAAPPRRTATAEKPDPAKALLADARRLRDRGRPQEALAAYNRALSSRPEDADALAGRGLCYLDLSQYQPAEASFEEALRASATHPEALMGLAETYRYEGRRAEAVTYYQRYVDAHPQGRDAAAARSAIEALKE